MAEVAALLPQAGQHRYAYFVIDSADDQPPYGGWVAATRGLVRCYHNAAVSIYAGPAPEQNNAGHNQQQACQLGTAQRFAQH